MYVAQKIEIEPTYRQKQEFERYFGYSRYIYNKTLEFWNKQFSIYKETGKKEDKPNFFMIKVKIKSSKKEWEKEMNPMIQDTATENVKNAFNLYFKDASKKPKFKTKRNSKQSFRFYRKNKSCIVIINDKLRLMSFYKKFGLIKMKEQIRYKTYEIKELSISKRAGKYFASFILKLNYNPYYLSNVKPKKVKYVGIDLGLKTFATTYDSKGNVKTFKIDKKKIKLIDRRISRLDKLMSGKLNIKKRLKLEKDSIRYLKMRTKLQRLYLKKQNIIDDFIHKLTHYLITNYKTICIEDLKANFMQLNHHLAKSESITKFYEFRCQMMYKAEWYGTELIFAPKTFPSTQTCSECGHQLKSNKKLKLSQRVFRCPKCGFTENRDINAARNLMLFGKEVSEHPERFDI